MIDNVRCIWTTLSCAYPRIIGLLLKAIGRRLWFHDAEGIESGQDRTLRGQRL